jgi:MFS family permease
VKLWAASTTSAFGSGLATIAAPLLVASRTSDPVTVSATFGVAWLPWLLFALPGGVLVDRVDRRRLMIVIDWVRVAAMAVLGAAIVTGRASLGLLFVVLFVVSTGEIVFRSASQAMIPSVVPRASLERANGWLVGGVTLMQQMIAGPLGGFLFVVAASAPFFVNAGTYAASALLIGLVAGTYRSPAREPEPAGVREPGLIRSVRADVAEGFRWLVRQRMLRTMAILIGLLNLTLTATWTIRIGLLIEAGMHLVLATSRSSYLVGFALFAFGVHGALWGIVGNSLRQRLTPPEMLGRVGSTTLFIAAGGNCVGALLGGVVAARFGLTAPYWVGFVVAVIVSALTWRVFDRATVARAYAESAPREPVGPVGTGSATA